MTHSICTLWRSKMRNYRYLAIVCLLPGTGFAQAATSDHLSAREQVNIKRMTVRDAFGDCVNTAVRRLDDGSSPVETVAKGAAKACRPEAQAFVDANIEYERQDTRFKDGHSPSEADLASLRQAYENSFLSLEGEGFRGSYILPVETHRQMKAHGVEK